MQTKKKNKRGKIEYNSFMTLPRKKQTLAWICGALLLVTVAVSSSAFAATSTISVTSTPFLSFTDVPDPFSMGSLTVPTADMELTSDGDGNLPATRHLTIQDTRGCGGLKLQLQAGAFAPASTQVTAANLKVVTSTSDQLSEPVVGNVEYITGFTGDQTITAPLNTASTTFSDPNVYTAVANNSLDVARDLLQGNLSAPAGRTGEMHVSISFYLLVPKLTLPSDYATTLTFTLSDDTTGVCP